MDFFKNHFTESKDQAVPFALPALRSYKQNLLFGELVSQIEAEFKDHEVEEKISIAKRLKSSDSSKQGIDSKTPKLHRFLKRGKLGTQKLSDTKSTPLGTNINNIKPSQRNSSEGRTVRKENTREAKIDPAGKIKEINKYPKTIREETTSLSYLKGENKLGKQSSSLEPHKNTAIRINPSKNPNSGASNPRNRSPNSNIKKDSTPIERSLESPQFSRNLKAKPATSYLQLRSRLNPNILKHKPLDPSRPESQNSKTSTQLPPRTPEGASFMAKLIPFDINTIPEIIPKRSRASATRSKSRRNGKQEFYESWLDLDCDSFKMSELSIAPLL